MSKEAVCSNSTGDAEAAQHHPKGWEDGRHVGVMEVEAMICTSYSIKGL